MYRFAAPLFIEEITEPLGLQYVFLFGLSEPFQEMCRKAEAKAGWRIYQPADGTGKPLPVGSPWSSRPTQGSGQWFIVLPHPQAWYSALAKAVKIALGDGARPEGPPCRG